MHEKTCSTCRRAMPLSDFHRNTKRADGVTGRCKACAIAAAKASYERRVRERNPEIDTVREHRARIEAARQSGQLLFTPLIACPAGHLTPRFVKSQCCKECSKVNRRTPEAESARVEKKRAVLRRRIAANNGQAHYMGAACKNGHDGKRLVSTRQCVDCLKQRATSRATPKSAESAMRRKSKRRTRAGRAKQRVYQRDVLMARTSYRLSRFIYTTLRRVLKSTGGRAAGRRSQLGYNAEKLRARIESQFRPGMSWSNYGEWHIDHRKPISAFLAQGVTDPAVINALCNLRPLWALENMSKGGLRRPRNTAEPAP